MLHLPRPIIKVLHPFRSLFHKPTWAHAQVLLAGTILTPGPRTASVALRVIGLSHEPHFQNYHRVLNRASWSSRTLSQLLLLLLLRAFVPDDAPVVVGIDETIRYHATHGKRHKKVTDWGRQLIAQLRRWLPYRTLVVVADSSYAVIELLAACQRLAFPVTIVTRLRVDAALYDPAPPRSPGATGRPRVKGARQPILAARLADPKTAWQAATVCWYGGGSRELEVASGTAVWYHSGLPPVPIRWVLIRDPKGHFAPQALLCTDPAATVVQIVEWFVLRWQLEVTFMRRGRIWGSKRNGNGRSARSPGPHRRCSGCFRWSACSRTSGCEGSRCRYGRQRGIRRLHRRLPIR